MHVYFVRHGETALSKARIHQSPNTPLSPRGRDDIQTTAEFLRSVNPDLLLSSEYTRALESARIIGLHTGLVPQVQGLFYEIVRPSKLFGKSIFSLGTFWYILCSVLKRNNSSWHYHDAENYADIVDRAKRALAYLESLKDTHTSVVVMSHTIFINIMVAYMCKNRILDIRDMLGTFLHIEHIKSGEVVHVEYVGTPQSGSKNLCLWRRIP
jgi:broad specificity phosphatase PhoE